MSIEFLAQEIEMWKWFLAHHSRVASFIYPSVFSYSDSTFHTQPVGLYYAEIQSLLWTDSFKAWFSAINLSSPLTIAHYFS
jgi:hypothetical protein